MKQGNRMDRVLAQRFWWLAWFETVRALRYQRRQSGEVSLTMSDFLDNVCKGSSHETFKALRRRARGGDQGLKTARSFNTYCERVLLGRVPSRRLNDLQEFFRVDYWPAEEAVIIERAQHRKDMELFDELISPTDIDRLIGDFPYRYNKVVEHCESLLFDALWSERYSDVASRGRALVRGLLDIDYPPNKITWDKYYFSVSFVELTLLMLLIRIDPKEAIAVSGRTFKEFFKTKREGCSGSNIYPELLCHYEIGNGMVKRENKLLDVAMNDRGPLVPCVTRYASMYSDVTANTYDIYSEYLSLALGVESAKNVKEYARNSAGHTEFAKAISQLWADYEPDHDACLNYEMHCDFEKYRKSNSNFCHLPSENLLRHLQQKSVFMSGNIRIAQEIWIKLCAAELWGEELFRRPEEALKMLTDTLGVLLANRVKHKLLWAEWYWITGSLLEGMTVPPDAVRAYVMASRLYKLIGNTVAVDNIEEAIMRVTPDGAERIGLAFGQPTEHIQTIADFLRHESCPALSV